MIIKKGILNHLIEAYDLTELEKHLIYSYLTNNKIKFEENPVLNSYFKDFKIIPQLFFDTSNLSLSNIKELENSLELIIPFADRKLNELFSHLIIL